MGADRGDIQALVASHAREFSGFYQRMAEVFSGYESYEVTERGFELRYPAEDPWPGRLDQLAEEFRRRLPAVEVEVGPDEAGDRLCIRFGGVEATKEFIAGIIVGCKTSDAKSMSPRRRRIYPWFRRATSAVRALPNFLIIGTPRCGTTTLYHCLTSHPRVLAATKKEVAFFDAHYGRGRAAYRAEFPLRSRRAEPGAPRGDFITGEATPTYLMHPLAPQRVREMLPDVKLIAILGNPVVRAYSHYHFSVRHGFEPLSFEEALDAEPGRLQGEREKLESDERYWSPARVYYSYLTAGIYVDQLEAWTKVFPREQLHVVCMEAFRTDPPAEFQRVLEFLGLRTFRPALFDSMDTFPYAPRHVKPKWPMAELAAATRERLEEHFRPHNERLWAFLGTDFGWKQAPAVMRPPLPPARSGVRSSEKPSLLQQQG